TVGSCAVICGEPGAGGPGGRAMGPWRRVERGVGPGGTGGGAAAPGAVAERGGCIDSGGNAPLSRLMSKVPGPAGTPNAVLLGPGSGVSGRAMRPIGCAGVRASKPVGVRVSKLGRCSPVGDVEVSSDAGGGATTVDAVVLTPAGGPAAEGRRSAPSRESRTPARVTE